MKKRILAIACALLILTLLTACVSPKDNQQESAEEEIPEEKTPEPAENAQEQVIDQEEPQEQTNDQEQVKQEETKTEEENKILPSSREKNTQMTSSSQIDATENLFMEIEKNLQKSDPESEIMMDVMG